MYRDFLAHSPLLAWPLFALGIFGVVFIAVVVDALTKRRVDCASAAALPLTEEEQS